MLDILGSLLDRELIKKDFDEKYPLIVKMMDRELDTAKVIYDNQTAAKKETGKASLHKNMPKVSGSLRWAQELRERISAPMGSFKSLEHRYALFVVINITFDVLFY
jgi:dynein heavy chain